jgi:anaerobic selenocysteine-containing dehydrogenase
VLTSGGRSNNYTHSEGRRFESLRRREPEPRAQISPADADARGITDGSDVLVTSPLGQIAMKAWVTSIVPAGVVHCPHGWPGPNDVAFEAVRTRTLTCS